MSNLWVDVASDKCIFFLIGLFTQALDKSLQHKIIQENGCYKG